MTNEEKRLRVRNNKNMRMYWKSILGLLIVIFLLDIVSSFSVPELLKNNPYAALGVALVIGNIILVALSFWGVLRLSQKAFIPLVIVALVGYTMGSGIVPALNVVTVVFYMILIRELTWKSKNISSSGEHPK